MAYNTDNMTHEMISDIAFREVSRVTQNISKDKDNLDSQAHRDYQTLPTARTAEMSRRMTEIQKRLRDLDYDRPLFY